MHKLVIVLLLGILSSCSSICLKRHAQIKQTVVRMVNAIDAKQWDAAIKQFDRDVFVDYESLSGQPGAQVAAVSLVGNWEKLLKKVETHHMLTNFDIKIDGDRAESFSHVYASHTAKGLRYWDAYGRYHHKLKKTKEGWKITFMKLIMHGQKGNKKFLQQVGR